MVLLIWLHRYCWSPNVLNTPPQLPVKFNNFSHISLFPSCKIQLSFSVIWNLCQLFTLSHPAISPVMSHSLSTSWSVTLTSGQGLVHSLHLPVAPTLLHTESPPRSSYAFLNFKIASVYSKLHVSFQTTAATISKLSILGFCTADLLLTSVKSKKEH